MSDTEELGATCGLIMDLKCHPHKVDHAPELAPFQDRQKFFYEEYPLASQ